MLRISLTILVLLSFPCRFVFAQESSGVYIEEVLRSVQDGIKEAHVKLSADSVLPPLAEVSLTLQTTMTKRAGGKFDIWVVSIGADIEARSSSKLALKLVVPTDQDQATSSTSIAKTLSNMIVSAAEGTYKIGEGPTPLILEQVTAELRFVIEKDASVSVGFDIVPLTAQLSGSAASGTVHTIQVIFRQ